MTVTSGIYRVAGPSGVIGAGITGGSDVYSFRWTSTVLQCLIRRVRISVGDTSTAFAAGTYLFNMFAARKFTASPSGGTAFTPVGNDGKLRTAYPNSAVGVIQIANTGALTTGTRALDAQAIGSIIASDPATAGSNIVAPIEIFNSVTPEERLLLMANEGFVLQATVPATGTWQIAVEVTYEEGTGF